MPLGFGAEPRKRRVKAWSIEVPRLLDLLRANDGIRRVHMDGLPADAQPVGVGIDHRWNTVVIYLESAEFDEVPDSQPSPELYVAFTEFLEREVPELP